MNRKTFLTAFGGAGLATLIPLSTVLANTKIRSLLDKIKGKVIKAEEGRTLNILGNRQIHKLTGKDTGNQMVEWIDYLAPGSGIPPHIHSREDEIFRVLEGQVEIMVDNKTTILKAGDIALAPKNIVHSWKVVGTENAKMCVSAYPSGMEHLFEDLDALPPGPPNFEQVAAISANHGIHFV